jgi:hypothetical protein
MGDRQNRVALRLFNSMITTSENRAPCISPPSKGLTDERRLSILQISTNDIGGGAEKVEWNLFRGYRERGYRSWLAVGTSVEMIPLFCRDRE